jgi:hypothetical protein
VALRFDIARFDKVERTPQGGLRVAANLTRTGVFTYRNADGTETRELRHPDDVFAADSLASFKQAPLTELHPSKPVDPSNWKELAVGHVGDDVHQDGDHVAAPVSVQDAGAVGKVMRGELKELSAGYTVDIVPGAGVYQGEKYDARQTNIRANHIAMGPEGWGRGGSTVALRLDAGDAVMVEGKPMRTIKIDGVDFEVGSDAHLAKIDEQHKAALAAEKKRADDAAVELAKKSDPKVIDAAVKFRKVVLDTHRAARALFVRHDAEEEAAAEGKAEGSDNTDLIAEVVKMCDPSFDPGGKSPDFIAGAFSVSIGLLKKMTGATDANGDEPDGDESLDADMQTQTSPDAPAPGHAPMYGRDSRSAVRGDALFAARAGRNPGRADAREQLLPDERMRHDHREAWKKPLQAHRGS